MRHPVKSANQANSLPDLSEINNAVRPNRQHFSSPATFFSESFRRARRNIGYPHLPLTTRRAVK